MVVTVTLNPSVDITMRTEELFKPLSLNRMRESIVSAGGKGVNAAEIVRELGGEVLAAAIAGGAAGVFFSGLLTGENLPHELIPARGETRVNIKVLDRAGMTEINSPGPNAGTEALRGMETLLLRLRRPDTVFVLSGSLPPDAPASLYADYINMLKSGGSRVILDASGEALRLGAAANPDMIRINEDEARRLRGLDTGGSTLIISRGERGASFFANGKELYNIPALPLQNPVPVGAGDAMTGAAAYSLDHGLSLRETAWLSMGAAAAAVMCPGTRCPPRDSIKKYEKLIRERYSVDFP